MSALELWKRYCEEQSGTPDAEGRRKMDNSYHHSQRTSFTLEQVQESVGKRAKLVLEGTIVDCGDHGQGPFAMFQIDERYGFGAQRGSADRELRELHARRLPARAGLRASQEGGGVMSELPIPGDRIELVEMGADPCPIPAGSKGTVRRVQRLWDDQQQISVDWDEDVGRSLALVVPPDRYRIIERVMD